MIEFQKVIRDPIHGYIGLTKEELQIINLPIFQRLRWISQLSLVYLVYPDAKHSRFGHSLGTMHLCGEYGEHFKKLGIIPHDDPDKQVELLRFAGLLHDIGHGPFSHALEPAFYNFVLKDDKGWRDAHVRHGQKIITDESSGIQNIIGEERAKKVSHLIEGDCYKASVPLIFRTAIKGLFKADRLDYLRRDAYHAGTPEYAMIDDKRIINSLFITDSQPLYLKKGLYALEAAILCYFFMYRALYFHHTTRSAYCIFSEACWQSFEDNILEKKMFEEVKDFSYFTDPELLSIIMHSSKSVNPSNLINCLITRNLPKRAIAESEFEEYGTLLDRMVRVIQEDYGRKRKIESKVKAQISANIFLIDTPLLSPYILPSEKSTKYPMIVPNRSEPMRSQPLHYFSPQIEALWKCTKRIPRIYIDQESLPSEQRPEVLRKYKKDLIDFIWKACDEIENQN